MMILIHIHTEKKPNSENDDWEHFFGFCRFEGNI